MKNYLGYTRVSTVKQGEKGVSLQEQRDAIYRYAERNSLNISEWFEEKETAAKRGRPVFARMMLLLRQDKATGVIIHKIDRSARNLKDWSDLGELIDRGVEVHFANESLDLHTRGGRLSADIQAVVAADFIRNLKEETRKGFYGRIKQGLYPLPAPLGYLDMGKGKPKVIDPDKAPLVKRAFELYSTGKYNLEELSEEMFRLGLRNKRGGMLSTNGFSWILNNPFYIGLIRLNKTNETFSGIHTPLFNKSLFDRVQNILTGKCNRKSQKYDFLFRRMLVCKNCNYSLTGEIQKGNIYYRCHTKGCTQICIKEEEIDAAVTEKLASLQLTDIELAHLKKKLIKARGDWESLHESQTRTVRLNLTKIQDRLARLTDAFIDGTLERELFEERKTALLLERKGLEEKNADLEGRKRSIPEMLTEFFELAGRANISYKMGGLEEKRDLLKIITSNRLVEGKNVELKLNFPFDIVENRQKNTNGAPYRRRLRTLDYLDDLLEKLMDYFKTVPDDPTNLH